MGRRLNVMQKDHFPAYSVWELTLACDHGCAHCGSRAGQAREAELTTTQALSIVEQLAEMKTREVVLIGGEAYLHDGFLDIVRALRHAGIRPSLTTGGRGITAALAHAMARAGLHMASISVDGLQRAHNEIRASKHSFGYASAAIENLKAAGIPVGANTNINRVNQGDLESLYEYLRDMGIAVWQLQLTAPLGRAADRPNLILQPWMLTKLLPRIAELKRRAYKDGISLLPGNNLGYFGPEEALLRSARQDARDHFAGCQAGRFVMGIESDGAVKACPSLQRAYIAGNLKETRLSTLWNQPSALDKTRKRTARDLWGFCRTCTYAETCLGGCNFTAHSFFGRPGNNPYCHHRAGQMANRGLRERLVLRTQAEGQPFDHALFELIEEPLDAPIIGDGPSCTSLVQLGRRREGKASKGRGVS